MKKLLGAVVMVTAMAFGCVSFSDEASAAQLQLCPQVEIIAARGTAEQGIGPQHYGSAQSNGFEGKVLGRFLRYMEQRYGPEFFNGVAITGVDDTVYRADPAIPEEVAEPSATGGRENAAWGFIVQYGPIRTIVEPIASFFRSAFDGAVALPQAMEQRNQQTGCRPKTIVLGYSQGAIVLQPYEVQLAQEGRLIGTLMMGDPQVKVGQVNVGQPQHSGGLFAGSSIPPQQSVPRFEYCKRNDFICDTSTDVVAGLDVHQSYFDPEAARDSDDEFVAEILAMWVETAQG